MTLQGQRPALAEIRKHFAGLDLELAGLLPGGLPAVGQEAPALLAGLPVLVLLAGLLGVLGPALLPGGAALPDHPCSLQDVQHAGGEGLGALLAVHLVAIKLPLLGLSGEVVGLIGGEPVDLGLAVALEARVHADQDGGGPVGLVPGLLELSVGQLAQGGGGATVVAGRVGDSVEGNHLLELAGLEAVLGGLHNVAGRYGDLADVHLCDAAGEVLVDDVDRGRAKDDGVELPACQLGGVGCGALSSYWLE